MPHPECWYSDQHFQTLNLYLTLKYRWPVFQKSYTPAEINQIGRCSTPLKTRTPSLYWNTSIEAPMFESLGLWLLPTLPYLPRGQQYPQGYCIDSLMHIGGESAQRKGWCYGFTLHSMPVSTAELAHHETYAAQGTGLVLSTSPRAGRRQEVQQDSPSYNQISSLLLRQHGYMLPIHRACGKAKGDPFDAHLVPPLVSVLGPVCRNPLTGFVWFRRGAGLTLSRQAGGKGFGLTVRK